MRGNRICAAVAALGVASVLSGCATPYQQDGLFGGLVAQRIDEHRVQISGRGNMFTPMQTMESYLLRRAAEETIKAGYKSFEVASSAGGERSQPIFLPGFADGRLSGNHVTTTILPSQVFTASNPDVRIEIIMSNDPAFDPPKPHVFFASDVLKFLATPGRSNAAPTGG